MRNLLARQGRHLCLFAVCITFLSSGCGTTAYNAELSKSVARLSSVAPFRALFAPTELPETPIRLRVPLVFQHSYVENSAHPDDGPKISPDRLQPPFLPLPGLKVTYETITQTTPGMVPFYCYLAAVPCKPGDAARLATEIQARLKQKFPETPDWETVDCNSPEGQPIQWKKIRAAGAQPFRVRDLGTRMVTVQELTGQFELWMHDAQEWIVLVGWRVTDLAMGSAAPAQQGKAPGAPASNSAERFNIDGLPALTAGSLEMQSAPAAPNAG